MSENCYLKILEVGKNVRTFLFRRSEKKSDDGLSKVRKSWKFRIFLRHFGKLHENFLPFLFPFFDILRMALVSEIFSNADIFIFWHFHPLTFFVIFTYDRLKSAAAGPIGRSEITGRYYQGSNSKILSRHILSQSHMPIVTSDTLGCWPWNKKSEPEEELTNQWCKSHDFNHMMIMGPCFVSGLRSGTIVAPRRAFVHSS